MLQQLIQALEMDFFLSDHSNSETHFSREEAYVTPFGEIGRRIRPFEKVETKADFCAAFG